LLQKSSADCQFLIAIPSTSVIFTIDCVRFISRKAESSSSSILRSQNTGRGFDSSSKKEIFKNLFDLLQSAVVYNLLSIPQVVAKAVTLTRAGLTQLSDASANYQQCVGNAFALQQLWVCFWLWQQPQRTQRFSMRDGWCLRFNLAEVPEET
jgi:hypothetical protein